MRPARTLLILSLAGFIFPRPAEARLNLPQARQALPLSAAAQTAARKHFSQPPAAGELPAPLQAALVESLPENFRNSCGNLMDNWAGERARGTGVWSVRLLDRLGARVWLAFRCGSRLQDEDMARYHDERLGLLRLDAGTLELLPLDPASEEYEGVYELDFANHLALPDASGFGFRVAIENNPCCDGPESRSRKRYMVFADTPRGIVESLSLVTARDDSSHSDDPEIDTETTYRADLKFERGANNLITALSADFQETVTDITWESGKANRHIASHHAGTLRYRWNPATFKFQEVR